MNLTFVHVTARRYLTSIVANGLGAGSYFSHADHVEIQEHLVADLVLAGHEPVVLVVEPEAFDVRHLAAAMEAIEHPMPAVLARMCCYELQDRWEGCSQTWRDCVELVGVCRHLLPIPARYLSVGGQPLVPPAKAAKRRRTARN
ncbi:MAG TPA: hypothetical protein VEZ89_16860 [Rubrivivax sp.]|nr:hypothetical protein [Rubrivivax sp.]